MAIRDDRLKRGASEPDRTESLRGTVERIVYANEENHYTVAVLTPDDASISADEVTVVGTFPGLVEGESVLCEGRWQNHKKFGRQFAVETFSSTTPPTLLGLERYLASDLIEGIGPEFAHRIVETFGEETLEVIEEEPRRLLEVPGIGRGRLEKITTSWGRHRAVRDVLVFLQGLGISAAYASRIYRRFGAGAIDLIKQNPYRLVEVRGIGFRTADKIAGNLGFDRDSMERARAGVLYALDELAGSGHTCFPRDRLVPRAAELLEVDADRIEQAIADEERDGRIVVEQERPGEPVYRQALHEAEFVVGGVLRH
ncbi:MAG: helix-hairpin-helix domain-containing protein, partial [Planctomycetota bacterium]